ncbi:hypothetical protein [Thermicanus aegyptius]|uniref:hypothetical protein n=1 Tax=Thermicanus aegyptius TaxID=94009 RepID=UPI0003F944EF|nr:hypothetical protein [Thermicanus aegyptius]
MGKVLANHIVMGDSPSFCIFNGRRALGIVRPMGNETLIFVGKIPKNIERGSLSLYH